MNDPEYYQAELQAARNGQEAAMAQVETWKRLANERNRQLNEEEERYGELYEAHNKLAETYLNFINYTFAACAISLTVGILIGYFFT